ncbi:MAG: hypothetical protein M3Z08_05165 [Chloroflexota bacterium]|nr:hypothetical protein [Chloroflexota bacterium]
MPTQFSPDTMQQFQQAHILLEQLDPQGPPSALIMPGAPEPRGWVIVFPSSFNPPTTAHLALLHQAQQFANQKGRSAYIYAAMSRQIIDKERVQRPLLLDRLVLLENVLRCHASGTAIMLFNRGLYVEQAKALHTSFPQVTKLTFLVGFDKIVQIFDPRYYANRDAALIDLFTHADILVAPRGEAGTDELSQLLRAPENRGFARHVHALPLDPAYRAVSSSSIRRDPSTHHEEVPGEVQQFIEETHAYDLPHQQAGSREPDLYEERVKSLETMLGQVM